MNNRYKIYLLAFISFLLGTSQFIIVGVLDQIATSLSITVSQAGQLVSIYALASAIGTPIIMMLTAKMDQRSQLLLSLVVFIIGVFAMLVWNNYLFIVISRAIVGIGAGVFVATAYAMSAKLAPAGGKGKAMSNIAMGFSIALVFGVPLGRLITAAYNWQAIFWLIAGLSIVCLFFVIRTMPKAITETPIPLKEQLVLLKQTKVISALGISFLVFVSYSMIYTYITPFLASIRTVSETEMSSILLLFGIASLIGSKLAGVLADRIGTFKTLLGSMTLHLLTLLGLYFTSRSLLLTSILLFIWVCASWTFGPAQSINLASIAPKAMGIMISLNSSFIQLGFALGAGLGGVTISHFPIITLSGVGSIFVLFAIGILLFTIKKYSHSLQML
ncbi:Purine efflux pump PbuE [Sulfurospirillum diekertiae]|uniref:Purine efflux pump PbuE n=1 Tax=Sulfurospirillum diekertiae TaxID=1854492 RepID=A0A290HF73_9BACT|nr:MFS transporter [Sulfurospirillum diekertiae]ATB70192.1 Purine efflux pump PbuE [Sulfurospirillum diekertiae]